MSLSAHPLQDPIELAALDLASARPALGADAPRERYDVALTALKAEGPRYWSIEVTPDEALRAKLMRPAQYTTVSLADLAPRYLAIASAPHETTWRFLIDRASTLGRMLELGHVDTLSVSSPEGSGWRLDLYTRSPLLAITTGSGIATLRAALSHLTHTAPHLLQKMSLFYGEQRLQDAAYTTERAEWEERGVGVFLAAEEEHPHGWRYVQQPLSLHAPEPLHSADVLLSGASVMIRHVSAALMQRGVPRERIQLNI